MASVAAVAATWSTEAVGCATCACGDPALVGAGGARPSEGRARVGAELRYIAVSMDEPFASRTRALRLGLIGDLTIVDGVALDAFVPVIAAHHDRLGVDASFADADVSARAVFLADRAFAPRAYTGLRGGLAVPLSAIGRDPRASRLDAGAWIPHAELFGALVRDAWFVSAALGARLPLAERIAPRIDLVRGASATAALRAQLQPRAELGVFLAVAAEAATASRVGETTIPETAGARAQVVSGVTLLVLEDVIVEVAAAAPLWQTQLEKLDATAMLTTTIDVGRR